MIPSPLQPRRQVLRACGIALVPGLWAPAARSAPPAGREEALFAPKAMVQGTPLQLNGAGVRHKAVFRVYAAGLYLQQRAESFAEVRAQPGAKRLAVTMLREIDSGELGKLFTRGMQDNLDRPTFSRLVPGILRMSQIFSTHRMLNAGDTFFIDWLPGQGTLITVKEQPQGEPFPEPEFFDAMLGIWLGSQPVDWKLKEALLGGRT